jgi:hypothetical protein
METAAREKWEVREAEESRRGVEAAAGEGGGGVNEDDDREVRSEVEWKWVAAAHELWSEGMEAAE